MRRKCVAAFGKRLLYIQVHKHTFSIFPKAVTGVTRREEFARLLSSAANIYETGGGFHSKRCFFYYTILSYQRYLLSYLQKTYGLEGSLYDHLRLGCRRICATHQGPKRLSVSRLSVLLDSTQRQAIRFSAPARFNQLCSPSKRSNVGRTRAQKPSYNNGLSFLALTWASITINSVHDATRKASSYCKSLHFPKS